MTGGSERDTSASKRWGLRAAGTAVVLLLLVAALAAGLSRDSAGGIAQALPSQPIGGSAASLVPLATADFVAAYGHSDYATIERIASPLYFVEWAREGVSLRDQASLLQQHQHSSSGEWLYFTYATGFVDGRGFGHYLYVGRPISSSGSASVWRVDSDSSGRVIWIELVWLFSSRSLATRAMQPSGGQDDAAVRAHLPALPSDVVFGVASSDGPEGYYGVAPRPGSMVEPGHADSVQFYAVDDLGAFRLPVWSYGEQFPNRPRVGRQSLQPEQSRALTDYLASIR